MPRLMTDVPETVEQALKVLFYDGPATAEVNKKANWLVMDAFKAGNFECFPPSVRQAMRIRDPEKRVRIVMSLLPHIPIVARRTWFDALVRGAVPISYRALERPTYNPPHIVSPREVGVAWIGYRSNRTHVYGAGAYIDAVHFRESRKAFMGRQNLKNRHYLTVYMQGETPFRVETMSGTVTKNDIKYAIDRIAAKRMERFCKRSVDGKSLVPLVPVVQDPPKWTQTGAEDWEVVSELTTVTRESGEFKIAAIRPVWGCNTRYVTKFRNFVFHARYGDPLDTAIDGVLRKAGLAGASPKQRVAQEDWTPDTKISDVSKKFGWCEFGTSQACFKAGVNPDSTLGEAAYAIEVLHPDILKEIKMDYRDEVVKFLKVIRAVTQKKEVVS